MEQLFKTREGHLPRLALLLRNHSFQKHVTRVVVDEAHNIYTAGLPHYGLDAFHPAWGHLGEFRAILPSSVRWAFLSATLPPHIQSSIEKQVLKPGYVPIHVSSNRPNTMYATHEVVNNIDDLCNYECFLAVPFSLAGQPRVLIFVDSKELACRISSHLDSCLPSQYQDRGVVKHYHSKMLSKYLEYTHEAFTTQTGICRVLVATSSQSVVRTTSLFSIELVNCSSNLQGVDFPDVKIVCTVGLPATTVDTLQRAGRALRNSDKDALFVIFYEPWAHAISLSEYNEGDTLDPDRPRGHLKSRAQKRERAPLSSLRLVKGPGCLRSEFASYLGDTSTEGTVSLTAGSGVFNRDYSLTTVASSLLYYIILLYWQRLWW